MDDVGARLCARRTLNDCRTCARSLACGTTWWLRPVIVLHGSTAEEAENHALTLSLVSFLYQ